MTERTTEEGMNILKEEVKIIREEKGLLRMINRNVEKLAIALERARIDEYTSMLTRPWKFFFFNFIAGIVRGLGIAIGMTIIAAILGLLSLQLLRKMVDMPIIGMYIAEIVRIVNQYLQQGIPVR